MNVIFKGGLLLVLAFSTYVSTNAHTLDTGMVDLHAHTTLKSSNRYIKRPNHLLQYASSHRALPEKYKKNWVKNKKIKSGEKTAKFGRTQCDYNRVVSDDYGIICTSISPVEKGHLDNGMKKVIAFFGGMKHRRQLMSEKNSTFKYFNAEYQYQQFQDETLPDKERSVVPARDNDHLRQLLAQKGTIPLIYTIEGLGALMGDFMCTENRHKGVKYLSEYPIVLNEYLTNIDSLKRLPNRIFFVALTHHNWDYIAGQARYFDKNEAVGPIRMRKVIQALNFTSEGKAKYNNRHGSGLIDTVTGVKRSDTGSTDFSNFTNECRCDNKHKIKVGNICTEDIDTPQIGYPIVNSLLSHDNAFHKPIYIDVKHMDVEAREDYFKILRERRAKGEIIPIIASHTAVSGKNRRLAFVTGQPPILDDYKEVRSPSDFYDSYWKMISARKCKLYDSVSDVEQKNVGSFYPFSLNLYDEEIEEIYNSDGIMGVILDERLLGSYMRKYHTRNYNDKLIAFLKSKGYSKDKRKEYKEIAPFLRNLAYIVAHSGRLDVGKYGYTAWEHIGIGSDFDGLIDPIDLCRSSSDMSSFEKKVIEHLPVFLQYEYPSKDIMLGLTPEQAIRKVFRTNAYNFILKYY